jgi:hypothetical protein
MRSAAAHDLPALRVAQEATDVLGCLLVGVVLKEMAQEQITAAVKLGIIAARSLRAELLLLEAGYHPEAVVFRRRLAEVRAYLEEVIHPSHGPHRAQAWLSGRPVRALSLSGVSQDVWGLLSHPAHADTRAVDYYLADIADDGVPELRILPSRHSEEAQAWLVLDAVQVRDIAVMIGRLASTDLIGLEELDAKLWPAYEQCYRHSLVDE